MYVFPHQIQFGTLFSFNNDCNLLLESNHKHTHSTPVSILVDVSGSMGSLNIQRAAKAVLARLAQKLENVPIEFYTKCSELHPGGGTGLVNAIEKVVAYNNQSTVFVISDGDDTNFQGDANGQIEVANGQIETLSQGDDQKNRARQIAMYLEFKYPNTQFVIGCFGAGAKVLADAMVSRKNTVVAFDDSNFEDLRYPTILVDALMASAYSGGSGPSSSSVPITRQDSKVQDAVTNMTEDEINAMNANVAKLDNSFRSRSHGGGLRAPPRMRCQQHMQQQHKQQQHMQQQPVRMAPSSAMRCGQQIQHQQHQGVRQQQHNSERKEERKERG